VTTRASITAAALAAAAALLLAACGGSGGGGGSGEIKGVGKGDSSASASPSASPGGPSSGPGRPVFDLPSDIEVKLVGFESQDAAKNEVLRDTSYAITAILEAEAKGDPGTAAYQRYFTGLQAAEFADTIIAFGKSGKTITGIYQNYRPTVKITGKTVAAVTYCEDQRKGYAKDRKTGKVSTTKPSLNDFSFWSMGFAKNTSGDWQVVRFERTKGAKQCQIG
jgi:hypothetical protein